jgi:hypothetical protein
MGFVFVGRSRLEPVMCRTTPQVETAAAPVAVPGGWVTFEHVELVYLVLKGHSWDGKKEPEKLSGRVNIRWKGTSASLSYQGMAGENILPVCSFICPPIFTGNLWLN